jgi:hypothetical protein
MKEEWKTYRTRFLVTAKQLSSPLTFVDHLGRQHRGHKGDYLVESSDGVLSITPRRIFEDIYVPMSLYGEPGGGQTPLRPTPLRPTRPSEPRLDCQKLEPLEIEDIRLPESGTVRQRVHAARAVEEEAADRGRKLPQPCSIRPSASRLGLM